MITSLRLQNFRSYTDVSFEFSDSVNILIGPNASGKTNALEGLVYVCRGVGFRGTDTENIMGSKEWARIDALTDKSETRTIKFERQAETTKKMILINDKQTARMGKTSALPLVLFEPNYLQQLTTSPEQRRTFLDNIIGEIDDQFQKDKRDYHRTLAQRNRLLKNGGDKINKTIFAWDIRLSSLGGKIVEKRKQIINTINKGVSESYASIAAKKQAISLVYKANLEPGAYASKMLKKLEKDLPLDILRGYTGAGPHRDDIGIEIDGHPIANFASRGETRTTLLALKIQETDLLEKKTGKKPLLLLDDVYSELDGKRRKALTAFVKDYQSFITTTDADIIAKNFASGVNTISL